MRIVHNDSRLQGGRLQTEGPIRAEVLRDLHAVDAVHPIVVATVSSYDGHSWVDIRFRGRGGRIRLWRSHHGETTWAVDVLKRLEEALPPAEALIAEAEAKPIVVQRCGAILASSFTDGRRFRHDVLASRPMVRIWPEYLVLESSRTDSGGTMSIAVPDFKTRELRVQVKAILPRIGVVDRTITTYERIDLPETVLTGLKGRRFDEVVSGTPFDGHDVRIDKLWTNGKGPGERLSLMATSDLIPLDEAVALIDRLRAPTRMAA